MTLPVSKSGIKRSFGEIKNSCEMYLYRLAWTTMNVEGKTGEEKKNECFISKRRATRALKNGKFDGKREDKGVGTDTELQAMTANTPR